MQARKIMSLLPTVQKAFFVEGYPGPFVVRDRPVPQTVGKDEVLIKIMAAAVNPVDTRLHLLGFPFISMFPRAPPQEQPLVLGEDLAGEVVLTGDDVKDLAVGDRVFGFGALGDDNTQAYQQYAMIPSRVAARIPEGISYESASTIPMGLSAAASGLYPATGLKAPWEGGLNAYSGTPIVISGASGSVGQYVVQLAKLSGFSPIIATASPQHESHLRSLGATHVVPRDASPSEIQKLAGGSVPYYFLGLTSETNIAPACDTLSPGGTLIMTLPRLMKSHALPAAEPKGIKVVTMASSPYSPLGEAFGVEMIKALPQYLAEGKIVPNRVKVVDGGLEGLREAFEIVSKGLSPGVKVVVHPQETI